MLNLIQTITLTPQTYYFIENQLRVTISLKNCIAFCACLHTSATLSQSEFSPWTENHNRTNLMQLPQVHILITFRRTVFLRMNIPTDQQNVLQTLQIRGSFPNPVVIFMEKNARICANVAGDNIL